MAEKTKFDFAQFIKKAAKRYFLDAMSAMALGLFASLIIGLIISQLSKFAFLSWLAPFGSMLAASSPVVGSAIGVACAFGLKVKPL
ncbi:MAG: PTS sugar transporter subunit IIC, partial [Clostridia bacterium]|nr:PTS sugar transporter subunit IIC [Clostridia bacterium]